MAYSLRNPLAKSFVLQTEKSICSTSPRPFSASKRHESLTANIVSETPMAELTAALAATSLAPSRPSFFDETYAQASPSAKRFPSSIDI
ncbi:hypothetical protein LTR15_005884 [Elasticomyces elasticus]|nr:hypothetical protein LTR15_005884 [Elasticomyces elasticus]